MRKIVVLPLLVWSMTTSSILAGRSDADEFDARAEKLAKSLLIVDTHIDAPIRSYFTPLDLRSRLDSREFDLPRAIEGGLDIAFMSIYTSPTMAEEGESRTVANALIDWTEELAQDDRATLVTCAADVDRARELGLVGLPMGMENGSPLENDVANLEHFYDRGIRYITLTHGRSNEFSDSSYDENEQWGGLSPQGEKLVHAMNERGVMIDISHLTDSAAWQVLKLSKLPVLATHSSLRHFIPGFHRNMSDDMVKAVAENGGVVHINFGSTFVSAEARTWTEELSDFFAAATPEGTELASERRQALLRAFMTEKPFPFATVETVVDHIDRVVALAGIDFVGSGSDYDGVGDTLPLGLKDVSQFPNLIAELLKRGYSEEDVSKFLGGNLMRVWKVNERAAAANGFSPRCSLL